MEISVDESADTVQFIARFGQSIIGYVGVYVNKEKHYENCKLFGLFVKNIFRGMGVGEQLCRYALQSAQDSGNESVQLVVGNDNYRAISFYSKLGFERMEHIDGEEAAISIDEIIMKKVLK